MQLLPLILLLPGISWAFDWEYGSWLDSDEGVFQIDPTKWKTGHPGYFHPDVFLPHRSNSIHACSDFYRHVCPYGSIAARDSMLGYMKGVMKLPTKVKLDEMFNQIMTILGGAIGAYKDVAEFIPKIHALRDYSAYLYGIQALNKLPLTANPKLATVAKMVVDEVDQLAFYNEFIAEKLRKYGNNSAAAPRLAQNYARFMAIYNLYLSKFPFYNAEDRRLKQTTVQLAAMRLTIELFRQKADEDRGGQPADAVLFAIGGDHAESVPMSAVFGSAGYDVAAQMLVRAQRFWMNLQRCPTYIQYALDLCSMTGEDSCEPTTSDTHLTLLTNSVNLALRAWKKYQESSIDKDADPAFPTKDGFPGIPPEQLFYYAYASKNCMRVLESSPTNTEAVNQAWPRAAAVQRAPLPTRQLHPGLPLQRGGQHDVPGERVQQPGALDGAPLPYPPACQQYSIPPPQSRFCFFMLL
ncbi:unnamed protein product, partial [Mesorhabditis spiculigera]